MKRTLAGIGIIALVLASCATKTSSPLGNASQPSPTSSSYDPEGGWTQPTTPQPANPVTILKKIKGCVIAPGVEAGQTDINGNRYAECSFKDNTSVLVTTFPGDPRLFEPFPEGLTSDDSRKAIIGRDFLVTIHLIDVIGTSQVDFDKVAQQVGGQLVPSKK